MQSHPVKRMCSARTHRQGVATSEGTDQWWMWIRGCKPRKRVFETDFRATVVVFDNLKRRGSELNLRPFKEIGIQFVHGDIRNSSNSSMWYRFRSLHRGIGGTKRSDRHGWRSGLCRTNQSSRYVQLPEIRAAACLQHWFFLSTSRVYSITALREIAIDRKLNVSCTRPDQNIAGLSPEGISEDFSTNLFRSFYGATKLSSEYLVQEFAAAYGLDTIIYRCGVIAGPGQFGRTDQGVFTLWVARHYFGMPLEYMGFGGQGKQVRDLLHPLDLFNLIDKHCPRSTRQSGCVYNVG